MQLWLIRHPKGSKVLFGRRRLLNLIIFIPVLLPMIFSNAKCVAAQQINNAVWRAALKDDGKTNQIHVEGQLMTSENIKLIKQPCHSKKKKKSHIFSAAVSCSPEWAWPGSQQMPQNRYRVTLTRGMHSFYCLHILECHWSRTRLLSIQLTQCPHN